MLVHGYIRSSDQFTGLAKPVSCLTRVKLCSVALGWSNPVSWLGLTSVKFCSVALANVYDADGSTIVIVCSDSSAGCILEVVCVLTSHRNEL